MTAMNSVADEFIKYIKSLDSSTDIDAKDVNNNDRKKTIQFETFIIVFFSVLLVRFHCALQHRMWSSVCSASMHDVSIEISKTMNF